ncbi:hypothetical protein HYU10_05025 [Candidatus Woesearchaeota archaeon]|nr:hypothetical protein [Candidatus Woesearchaeota archaeon]MBI2660643.1 hypothetical protein [Candidatus Woesearchaeota archaeon]
MAKEENDDDEEYTGEQHEEDDVYEKDEVEQELENDEISPKEAGEMEGFDRDAEKEERKHPKKKGRR